MFTSLRLSLFFCLRTLTGFFPLYSLKGLSCFSCEATNKSLNNLVPRFRNVFCTTTTAAATFISRKSATIHNTKTNPVNFSRTFKRFSFLDFSLNKSIACLIGPELQHLQTYCSSTPPGKAFTLSLVFYPPFWSQDSAGKGNTGSRNGRQIWKSGDELQLLSLPV